MPPPPSNMPGPPMSMPGPPMSAPAPVMNGAPRPINVTVLLENGSPLGQIVLDAARNLTHAREIIAEELDFVPASFCFLKNQYPVASSQEHLEPLHSFGQTIILREN